MPLKISDLQAHLAQQSLEWSAPDEANIPIIFPKYQTIGRKRVKRDVKLARRALKAAQRRQAKTAPIEARVKHAPSPVADRDIFTHRKPAARGYATSYATDDWREQK